MVHRSEWRGGVKGRGERIGLGFKDTKRASKTGPKRRDFIPGIRLLGGEKTPARN